jgi:holo-[acyl-carrier protein] synthase
MYNNERIGIGCDIECVSRFDNLITKKRFLSFFSNNELDYCYSKSNPIIHIAARFAGKEAIIKAMGSVELPKIPMKNIEILKKNNGSVYAIINDKFFYDLHISLSLSHLDCFVLAFAIVILNPQQSI